MIPTSDTNNVTIRATALFRVNKVDLLKLSSQRSSRFIATSLFFVFNRALLDSIELLESYGVFYFLTYFPEYLLVHSSAAGFFKANEEFFYRLKHDGDRADGVIHHLVAHVFQFPNSNNGPAKAV